MTSCIFCEIIANKIPADLTYEDDQIIVFSDINPKAKTHLLCVPKTHIDSLATITHEHASLMQHMIYALPKIAEKHGLSGFRTIINTGKEGGQEIDHLHFHILSGDAAF